MIITTVGRYVEARTDNALAILSLVKLAGRDEPVRVSADEERLCETCGGDDTMNDWELYEGRWLCLDCASASDRPVPQEWYL